MMLACTVRSCGEPLARRGRLFVCPRGHTFDVARSGYVNLLQPQDRRSPHAGDAREAIQARSRLFAAGIGRAVVSRVADLLALPGSTAGSVPVPDTMEGSSEHNALPGTQALLDLGCGSGDTLALLAASGNIDGIGIDLSVDAVEAAARAYPAMTWVVANADRRLPILDASVDAAVSIHGRRNPAECARVLKPGGCLIVAIPSADDMIELREHVMGRRVERDRSAPLLAAHAPQFVLAHRETIRERHALSGDRLRDLLVGTYRGSRRSTSERSAALERLEITAASELFVFTPAGRRIDGEGPRATR